MSFSHLRLNRIEDDAFHALYVVESPDFNSAISWEEIGRLRFDKPGGTYTFTAGVAWEHHKFVPPWVYGLPDEEQSKLLLGEYKDHGCGAWTMRIHHWATKFLQKGEYPEQHPMTYFK